MRDQFPVAETSVTYSFWLQEVSFTHSLSYLGRILTMSSAKAARIAKSASLILAPVLMAALGGVGIAGCSDSEQSIDFSIELRIVDENANPLAGATIDTGSAMLVTDENGSATVTSDSGPVLAIVSAPGALSEPVAFGPGDADEVFEVRLWSALGGTRWTMHSGGDAMLARRYVEPPEGEPLLPSGNIASGANEVVSSLSRAFSAADVSMLNLETVVSELPLTSAYPGKRFILNTHPAALAAIEDIGTDVVVMGNNHARDYLDEGVAVTLDALDDIGMPYTGASEGLVDAEAPVISEVAGMRVATLSWTTVSGSFVNDSYPGADDAMPSDIDDDEMWQYEPRMWGFEGTDSVLPAEARRIGEAWRVYRDAEDSMSEEDVAMAWRSLIEVYPELQDWVARRGHGGAAYWRREHSSAVIEQVAAENDLVVVQLHSGFQFQPTPSSYVHKVVRYAIDAGADIVIAHHPHVLQGAEWYKGKLIVYSLGNFIFDQDFFATFPSAFLRTVWEGEELLEARFVLLELAGYRPIPVTEEAAVRTGLDIWEKSVMSAVADRDINGDVRVFASEYDEDTVAAHMRMRNNGVDVVTSPPAEEDIVLNLSRGEIHDLDYDGLIFAQASGGEVLLGRDLYGWGHFEDVFADGVLANGSQWKIEGSGRELMLAQGADSGIGHLRLSSKDSYRGDVFVRPVARIPLPSHRLNQDVDGNRTAVPMDGPASYSVRMRARLRGQGTPYLRISLYQFDDTNPTEDPNSLPVGEKDVPIEIEANNTWQTIDIPVPEEVLTVGDLRANMVMIYVRFGKPDQGTSMFDIDDFALIEWRTTEDAPARYGCYKHVQNPGSNAVQVTLKGLPLRSQ